MNNYLYKLCYKCYNNAPYYSITDRTNNVTALDWQDYTSLFYIIELFLGDNKMFIIHVFIGKNMHHKFESSFVPDNHLSGQTFCNQNQFKLIKCK